MKPSKWDSRTLKEAVKFLRRVLPVKGLRDTANLVIPPNESEAKAPEKSIDQVDLIFRRSLVWSSVFTKSWGSPEILGKIAHFRRNYMGKGLVPELLERKTPTMIISKDWERKDIRYVEGKFRSPLFDYCPEFFPTNVEICHWRGLFPVNEKKRKGLVIHLAGTGDHTYFRREYFLCRDLLESGYSAIIVENPFYGSRKPDGQFSSSLRNVSDLFVMGGSLMAECGFILQWAKQQGHEILGLSGMSMGGYMASLAASNVHEPIALIPCLSWTTAAPVYTEGALSDAVCWNVLAKELADPVFRNGLKQIKDCDWLDLLDSEMFNRHTSPEKRFMWILMEEFTNLRNFPVPFEPTLIKAIIAEEDAYVIRNDVPDMTDVWPGSHVQIIPKVGHILAYLMNHGLFRRVVSETMEATAQFKTCTVSSGMVSVSTQLSKELPKLSAQKSVGVVEKSYPPVRNRLVEQDQRAMNQTYTIGTRQLMAPSAKPRERSCSIDSEIADYSIQGTLAGLFPRTFNKPNETSATPTRNPSVGHGSLTRIFSTKLPSLEGCSPERKCCQQTFGRAQMDLQKYKNNLKSSAM